MKDVVYEDENYTLGSYYRGDLLAREIAKKHNRLVFLQMEVLVQVQFIQINDSGLNQNNAKYGSKTIRRHGSYS